MCFSGLTPNVFIIAMLPGYYDNEREKEVQWPPKISKSKLSKCKEVTWPNPDQVLAFRVKEESSFRLVSLG